MSRPSLWHVSRPVTSACVDDFPIREAWHGVGVDDPFDVGGGIDRRELAGTPQICGDHLADAAREFAFGRAVAEKVGNGDRHRLDGALVHLQPEHRTGGLDHAGRGNSGSPGQKPTAGQQARARGNDVGLFDFHANDPKRRTPNSIIEERPASPYQAPSRTAVRCLVLYIHVSLWFR